MDKFSCKSAKNRTTMDIRKPIAFETKPKDKIQTKSPSRNSTTTKSITFANHFLRNQNHEQTSNKLRIQPQHAIKFLIPFEVEIHVGPLEIKSRRFFVYLRWKFTLDLWNSKVVLCFFDYLG